MATSPVITLASTANGLAVRITNPWPGVNNSGMAVSLYVDTDAGKIPPAATSATAVSSATLNDQGNISMLWSGGTAGTAYVASVSLTNVATGETVTSAASAAVVFPTISNASAPLVLNATGISAVVANDGGVVINTVDGLDMWQGGGSGKLAGWAPGAPTVLAIKRTSTGVFSSLNAGYTTLASVTELPFKDTTALPGVEYFYGITGTDANGEPQVAANTAAAPTVVPNNTGAVVPAAPSLTVYPTTDTLWLYITANGTGGAPIQQYKVYVQDAWVPGLLETVQVGNGPWYRITTDSTGAALSATAPVKIQISAVNSVGEGSKTGLLENCTLASAASALAITAPVVQYGLGRDPVAQYGISGGTPPYKAVAYSGTAATVSKTNAIYKISSAMPGFACVTNTQGKNILVVVTDSAGATAQAQFNTSSQGHYAPGDMSEFISGWIAAQDTLYVSRPTAMRRIFLSGTMPASSTDTGTVHIQMVDGQTPLFNVKANITIQGQTSEAAPSKGYKIKTKNKDTGDKMLMKFGNWPAASTFDLKSYGFTDDTMMRDILANRLWSRILTASDSFPDVLGFDEAGLGAYNTPLDYYGEAVLCTDGFPVEMFINGVYQGLYMWRLTVTPEVFQMDDDNMSNILMKYDHTGGSDNGQTLNLIDWSSTSVVSANWGMESPDIKAYTDQSQLETQAPDQYAAFNAVFTALGTYSRTMTDTSAIEVVFDKDRAIDYAIFSSLVANVDGIDDNLCMASWDGKKFSMMAYDLDLTFGNSNGHAAVSPQLYGSGMAPYDLVYNQWRKETEARYRYLRDTGVISVETLVRDAARLSGQIGRVARAANKAEWGYFGGTGQNGTVNQASLKYVVEWFKASVAYLDGQFGYAGADVVAWA